MSRPQLLKLLNYASARDSINAHAIAFILTEMRFRGPVFRACEVAVAIWYLYLLRRDPKLTLGKCQVSFEYWRARFGQNNLDLIRAAYDDSANYEICCDYLRINEAGTLQGMVT